MEHIWIAIPILVICCLDEFDLQWGLCKLVLSDLELVWNKEGGVVLVYSVLLESTQLIKYHFSLNILKDKFLKQIVIQLN